MGLKGILTCFPRFVATERSVGLERACGVKSHTYRSRLSSMCISQGFFGVILMTELSLSTQEDSSVLSAALVGLPSHVGLALGAVRAAPR
jgi:hypothetical protein